MNDDPEADKPGTDGVVEQTGGTPSRGPAAWLRNTNRNPEVVALIRRARKLLPGDPDFGDPLSVAGDGGALAAMAKAVAGLPGRVPPVPEPPGPPLLAVT